MELDLDRIKKAFQTEHHRFIFHKDTPKNLLEALSLSLPQIDIASWESRFEWGGILVNGLMPITLLDPLPTPCKIDYYEPKFDFTDPHSVFPKFSPSWILFEDQDLIVTYKPSKLPSLPALEQQKFNLRSYLEKYTDTQIHMPSRLDMSTSGLLVVSKSNRMHNLLQEVFEKRQIEKNYLFHTSHRVNWRACHLQTRIGKSALHPVLREVTEMKKNSKIARTNFKLLKTTLEGSLVKAELLTGRTHQIRVHSSFLGVPITGDNFYGGKESASLRLVSYYLRFRHPLTKLDLSFELPDRFISDWLTL